MNALIVLIFVFLDIAMKFEFGRKVYKVSGLFCPLVYDTTMTDFIVCFIFILKFFLIIGRIVIEKVRKCELQIALGQVFILIILIYMCSCKQCFNVWQIKRKPRSNVYFFIIICQKVDYIIVHFLCQYPSCQSHSRMTYLPYSSRLTIAQK